MRHFLGALVVLVVAAPPVAADVTITSTITGQGPGMGKEMKSVMYIKGSKMRTDRPDRITILDAATGQMTVINTAKKQADVYDMAKLRSDTGLSQAAAPRVEVSPNGQTKDILGKSCTGYSLKITVSAAQGDQTLNIVMEGPVFIAKGAPGTADYAGFYKAAADNGLFFVSPDEVKAQAAQAKSTVEMYRTFASLGGVPYQSDVQIHFEGTGMMAAMMNKIGGFSASTLVTGVSTDAIGDSMFTVPAEFTTNKR